MYKLYLFNEYERLSEEFISRSMQFLPENRRARALRYRRTIDRWNCVITYLLLLYGLRECFGITSFEIAFGEYGKPYIPEYPRVHFSISHCDMGCAVVVSNCPAGVDIQDVRPFSWDVAKRVCCQRELNELRSCPDPEQLFAKMWAVKESYGKMIGVGMRYEFQNDCRMKNDVAIYVDERKNFTTGLCLDVSADCSNSGDNFLICAREC